MRAALCFLLLAGSLLAAEAEKSKALVTDSMRCWSAFECYHFAAIAGESELAEKLLAIGYLSGRRFLKGAEDGELLPEDRKEIAVVYGLASGGPSIDFVLGRLFEKASEDLDESIEGVESNEWKGIAKRELDSRNAVLIVDGFSHDEAQAEAKEDEALKRYLEYLRKLRDKNSKPE